MCKKQWAKNCSLYTLDWLSTWRLFIQTVFILALQTKFFFLSFGKEYQILKQVHKVSLGKKSKWENKIKFLKLAYPFKIFGEYNWSISSIVLFGGYWAVNCFLYFLNFAMETWMVEDFIPWWLRWILLEIMCYNNYIKKWV